MSIKCSADNRRAEMWKMECWILGELFRNSAPWYVLLSASSTHTHALTRWKSRLSNFSWNWQTGDIQLYICLSHHIISHTSVSATQHNTTARTRSKTATTIVQRPARSLSYLYFISILIYSYLFHSFTQFYTDTHSHADMWATHTIAEYEHLFDSFSNHFDFFLFIHAFMLLFLLLLSSSLPCFFPLLSFRHFSCVCVLFMISLNFTQELFTFDWSVAQSNKSVLKSLLSLGGA